MKRTSPLRVLFPMIGLVIAGCANLTGNTSASEPRSAPPDTAFVTAHGSTLYRNGEPLQLRAMNFGNGYREPSQDVARDVHHTPDDFARVRKLGFNTIRFALNGNWFERDQAGFLTWLDGNIALARHAGLGVILDLHVPIGGLWVDPFADNPDFSLWSDASLRARNTAFWQAVATRYADEPAIVGYDLLNEPVTLDEDGSQWRTFAAELVRSIRAVDEHHLIVVQRLHGTRGRYATPGGDAQFLVDDANVLYDTHFHEPVAFTRPHAGVTGEPGRYPDPEILEPTGRHRLDASSRIRTATLPGGTTDWASYASRWQSPRGRRLVAAAPQAVIRGPLGGRVSFDDLVIRERLPDGTERVLVDDDMDAGSAAQWYDWSSDTAGDTVSVAREQEDGNTRLSIALRGTGINTVAGFRNAQHWFRVTRGARYRVEGRMRGEDVRYIAGERGSSIAFELDFFARQDKDEPVVRARDRTLLAAGLERWTAFGRRHAVPVSVLQAGVASSAFGANGTGGEAWLADFLSLMNEQQRSYGIQSWHDEHMGLHRSGYAQPAGAPDEAMMQVLSTAQGHDSGTGVE